MFTKKVLGRKDILKHADNIKKTEVSIPEWDGVVYVREMTAGDYVIWQDFLVDEDSKKEDIRGFLMFLTIVDQDNNRIFTKDDIQALAQLPYRSVNVIIDVIDDLNGFKIDKPEEAEAKN